MLGFFKPRIKWKRFFGENLFGIVIVKSKLFCLFHKYYRTELNFRNLC